MLLIIASTQRNNNKNMILRLLTLLFLVFNAASAVAAGDMPRVRFGDHPTYSRAVFEWKTLPNFTVTRQDKNITIRFDKKTDLAENTLKRALSKAFSGIKISQNEEADTTIILSTTKEIANLKAFTVDGNKAPEIKALEPQEKLPSVVLEKSIPAPQKISKTQDDLKPAESKPDSLKPVEKAEEKLKETAPLEEPPVEKTEEHKKSAERQEKCGFQAILCCRNYFMRGARENNIILYQ